MAVFPLGSPRKSRQLATFAITSIIDVLTNSDLNGGERTFYLNQAAFDFLNNSRIAQKVFAALKNLPQNQFFNNKQIFPLCQSCFATMRLNSKPLQTTSDCAGYTMAGIIKNSLPSFCITNSLSKIFLKNTGTIIINFLTTKKNRQTSCSNALRKNSTTSFQPSPAMTFWTSESEKRRPKNNRFF